jgi:membrane protease YdiL (CAAX protease family)
LIAYIPTGRYAKEARAMRLLRLVLGVLLWVLVLAVSSVPVMTETGRALMAKASWLSAGTLTQVMMLAVSLVLISALSRGRLSRYGFKMATAAQTKAAFIYGSITAVVVQVALAVIWRVLPPSEGHPALAGSSLLQIVITVWVLASICEEVFHRGLIQTFLEPLRGCGLGIFGFRLSLPVIVAAVLFGAGHIMLLTIGADGYLVGGIVGSATVLGLAAGYYREKTGSLVPAILIHMLFNAYGGASEYLQELVMK